MFDEINGTNEMTDAEANEEIRDTLETYKGTLKTIEESLDVAEERGAIAAMEWYLDNDPAFEDAPELDMVEQMLGVDIKEQIKQLEMAPIETEADAFDELASQHEAYENGIAVLETAVDIGGTDGWNYYNENDPVMELGGDKLQETLGVDLGMMDGLLGEVGDTDEKPPNLF